MTKKFTIDKNSQEPIYQQLYTHFKELIENGTYQEGDTIPSENEMLQEYDASRITIRRAINDLEHDGYLKKRRGAGTIVAPLKTKRDLLKFNSFGGSARVQGHIPGSIILEFKTIEASVKVASMLKIENSEKVYFLKRIRLLNGRIVGINETYVSRRLNIKLDRNDFNVDTSLYELLESRGAKLGCADETMEARMASNELKRELFLDNDQPVVYKERITYDTNGCPVEFSENTYIAELYKYSIHIDNVNRRTT